MAKNTKKESSKKSDGVIIHTNSVIGPKTEYAQLVNISIVENNVTNEVMFEFAYVNPRESEAHVVSRITMPSDGAKMIPELMKTLFEENEKKKSK